MPVCGESGRRLPVREHGGTLHLSGPPRFLASPLSGFPREGPELSLDLHPVRPAGLVKGVEAVISVPQHPLLPRREAVGWVCLPCILPPYPAPSCPPSGRLVYSCLFCACPALAQTDRRPPLGTALFGSLSCVPFISFSRLQKQHGQVTPKRAEGQSNRDKRRSQGNTNTREDQWDGGLLLTRATAVSELGEAGSGPEKRHPPHRRADGGPHHRPADTNTQTPAEEGGERTGPRGADTAGRSPRNSVASGHLSSEF